MSTYSDLPLSNVSYTNKDFQTIFPELLTTVSKLTNKWNPLSDDTNESDPGIVLVKLMALIGDKINYNIDKNVLECFPLSVTQDVNARRLYSQLGYNMRWYRSATTDISMKYLGTVTDTVLTIPAFTMVSDELNSIVYTLLGDAALLNDTDDFDVSDKEFPLDGSTVTFKAIEGASYEYSINGETTIQAYHLDGQNRLYFNSRDIPENGVFITNILDSGTNYGDWKRKDNLLTENLNNTFYSFGVSDDGMSCYIEFPQDSVNIFKNGIHITYVKTHGSSGNIGSETIEKFYSDFAQGDIMLTTDNVKMWNASSTSNGQNPETMNSALRSYKKICGTFDTLITLRDYTNYLRQYGEDFEVSNGYACDRTNDIQTVYNIVTSDNQVSTWIPFVEQVETEYYHKVKEGTYEVATEAAVSAFDLKLYLFARPTSVENQTQYDKTFSLLKYADEETYNDMLVIQAGLEDVKSIPHDYSHILPTTSSKAHICLIKNKYPVSCKIYTRQKFDTATETEIKSNIKAYLWANFNSQVIDFSETITADWLADIIANADNRIKKVVMDEMKFTTYAVYWNGGKYYEVPLNGDDIADQDLYQAIDYKVGNDSSKDFYWYQSTGRDYAIGDIVLFPIDDTNFLEDPSYIDNYPLYDQPSRWICTKNITKPAGLFKGSRNWTEIPADVYCTDIDVLQSTFGYGNYGSLVATYSAEDTWVINTTDGTYVATVNNDALVNEYGLYVDITNRTKSESSYSAINIGDKITFGPSKSLQCRDEIYTKSILNGSTPLFEQSEEFDYTYNQTLDGSEYTDGIYRDVKAIKTTDTQTFPNATTHPSNPSVKLRPNESIQFLAPNLIEAATYSNSVKICYSLNETIGKNVARRLDTAEWVALFWKDASDDTIYTYRIYYGCDADDTGTQYWMCPTFDMTLDGANAPTESISSFVTSMSGAQPTLHVVSSSSDGNMPSTVSEDIGTNMYEKKYLLSGTKELAVDKKNSIKLDSTFYCYWVLKDEYKEKYTLFNATTTDEIDPDTGYIYPDYGEEGCPCPDDPTFHPSYQEYVLGTGEYFFYLKGSLTEIAVLGAGTTIRRDAIFTLVEGKKKSTGFSRDWVVSSEVGLTNIMESGYTAFQKFKNSSLWFTPSDTEETVKVTENQYVTIGPNSSLKFYLKEDEEITIDSNLISISDKISDIQYLPSTSNASASTWTSIKTLISNFTDLSARALLSVNVSANERQVLYDDQNLILYDSDEEEIVTLYGSDAISTDGQKCYPTVIQSSKDISMDGTAMYNVYTTDEDGNIEYSNIYSYSETGDSDSVVYSSDGDCVVTISSVTSYLLKNASLSFMIPPTKNLGTSNWEGKYLIKAKTSSTELEHLWFYLNDVRLLPIKYSQYTYKGEVDSYEDLPITGNNQYDLYVWGTEESQYSAYWSSQESSCTEEEREDYWILMEVNQYRDGWADFVTANNKGKNCYISFPITVNWTVQYYAEDNFEDPIVDEYFNYTENDAEAKFKEDYPEAVNGKTEWLVEYIDGTTTKYYRSTGCTSEAEAIVKFIEENPTFTEENINEVKQSLTSSRRVDTLKMEVESTKNEGTVNITLSNPFRYKPPTTMTGSQFEKFMKLVQSFDVNDIYDYTYQVDEEKGIANPLLATEFLNQNHIMYDFTICQMETIKDANLSITGETS